MTRSKNSSTSLKEMGFTLIPIKTKSSKFAYIVRGQAPVYYLKRMRNGKLAAYKEKEATLDTSVHGLYRFTEKKDGENVVDLVGEPFPISSTSTTKKPVQPAKAA